jgi:transposase InsO family protein
MARVMGVSPESLKRWTVRQGAEAPGPALKRGRPEVIPAAVQLKIRTQYLARYKQWGPRVLADWVNRQGWGKYSPETISRLLEDLKDKPEPKEPLRRYAITVPQVMWSEDGAGFKEHAKKKELLILQDECARYKVNTRLVEGPARSQDVYAYLKEAFAKHGPPLVLKHDGGAIFHEEAVQALLDEHQVISLTSPPHYPPFNGKMERTVRDIKSYERAMRPCNRWMPLKERLEDAIRDLNEERPRPVLGGRTAKEVFEEDRVMLADRRQFYTDVQHLEQKLMQDAASRSQQRQARQKAVELVLLQHGYMKELTDVSTYSEVKTWTN